MDSSLELASTPYRQAVARPIPFANMSSTPASPIAEEVLAGFSRSPKEIHCKFFYDPEGSRLFEQICELEEYYPTRTELAIMRRHAPSMARLLGPRVTLIEYGSGAGLKTPLLLEALEQPVAYVPIDISDGPLRASAARLAARFPSLEVLPLCLDYTSSVELPGIQEAPLRQVVYFPGSTIGNFPPEAAIPFLRNIGELCGPGGALLIGVDLEKDPDVLHRAYNDARGVTAAFNLNLLARFNRELAAGFDIDSFRHQAIYNTADKRIEMYLVSERRQSVTIAGTRVEFDAGEKILTEYSYKYSRERFHQLAATAGWSVEQVWTDDRELFSVQYLTTGG